MLSRRIYARRQQVRGGDKLSVRIIVAYTVSRGGSAVMSPDQCSTRKVLDLKWERAVCKKLVIALV